MFLAKSAFLYSTSLLPGLNKQSCFKKGLGTKRSQWGREKEVKLRDMPQENSVFN